VRIAFASDWWPPRIGGVERQTFDLATELAARGHDVHVLTTSRGPTRLPNAPSDRVQHVDVPMAGAIALPDPRLVSTIADRLRRIAPDLVHAHGMFSAFAVAAIVAADRLGVPSVFTVHSLLRPLPVMVSARALFRACVNRATAITTVSAATAGDVRAASGRDVVHIPNGLRLTEWLAGADTPVRPSATAETPVRADERDDVVRIVAVMRLAPKKRPLDLVRALAAATRRSRSRPVVLEIAGDGSQRAAVEREAHRLGVREHLVVHGACSRPQVRALLQRASFLAQPGSREAFGLAVLEARAGGVPVVAMAAGGVAELVDHGRNGLLARSSREFHDLVATMAVDAQLRRRCALAAPRDLERYDWSRIAAQHEALYERSGVVPWATPTDAR